MMQESVFDNCEFSIKMAIIDEVQIGNNGRVSSKFLVRARF